MIPSGYHFVLELYDCPRPLLDDLAVITAIIHRVTARAELTLLDEVCHRFEPQGATALALLAESHLSIHTWPEHGYAAADLFTCGDRAKAEAACRFLVEALHAGRHSLSMMQRGKPTTGACRALPRVFQVSTDCTRSRIEA